MKLLKIAAAALMLVLGTAPLAAQASEGGGEAPKIAYVKMDPLSLPVIDKTGIVQIINVSITLEAVDEAAAKEIELNQPRLKDAYIQEMYGTLSRKGAMDAAGVLVVNSIKQKLNKITQRVMGEDKVKEVLLQAVNQRRA